jgi:hypothetical protein
MRSEKPGIIIMMEKNATREKYLSLCYFVNYACNKIYSAELYFNYNNGKCPLVVTKLYVNGEII